MEGFDDMDLYYLDELLSTDEIFQYRVENIALIAELNQATRELAEAKREIKNLKRRIDGCESAILWCGESCWDEISLQDPANWRSRRLALRPKRRRTEPVDTGNSPDSEQTVIDLTEE